MDFDELRKACQHEKLVTNTGLTLLNRKLSIYLTSLCIKTGVTANQATISSIFIGIFGSILFIPGFWWLNILGILFLWLSLTLDQVDGELARYYRTVSLNGVYLDEIRHIVIYSVTVFCLSFFPARELNTHVPFILGFIGAMVLVLSRVEERLPYILFVDKIILKNNFTFGEVSLPKSKDLKNSDQIYKSREKKYSISKRVSLFMYSCFKFMADQVGILICLFLCTILDAFLFFANVHLVINAQCVFLSVFSLVGLFILYRTIYGHWLDNWGEKICQGIIVNYNNKKIL